MPPSWRDHAACNGEPTQLFFPEPDNRQHDYDKAKSICMNCPVRDDCLDYALSGEQGLYGMWGGTTPKQRRVIRRRRRLGEVIVLDITQQMILDIA